METSSITTPFSSVSEPMSTIADFAFGGQRVGGHVKDCHVRFLVSVD